MRIGVLPRQIVFGDDHAGGAALRPRQRLEVVFLGLRIGQADVDQELRRRLRDLGIDARPLAARAAADQQLRLRRRRARIVAAHPVEHLDPFVDVVLRREQPLQGVAAGAAGEELLLAVGAGEARHPFGVGELQVDVARAIELEVGGGVAAGRDLDRLRALEDVADGADRDRVLAGLHAVGREAVAALFVGHHRGGDGRAFALGIDQDAFHRGFLGRGDLSAQRGRGLGIGGERPEQDTADDRPQAQSIESHGFASRDEYGAIRSVAGFARGVSIGPATGCRKGYRGLCAQPSDAP